jgi:hypothetical protein
MNWRDKNWKLNAYLCEVKHITTTVDVDLGSTPNCIDCPECKDDSGEFANAISMMYPRARPVPDNIPDPTYEWYRAESIDLSEEMQAYCDSSGLFLRERTEVEPICHPTT